MVHSWILEQLVAQRQLEISRGARLATASTRQRGSSHVFWRTPEANRRSRRLELLAWARSFCGPTAPAASHHALRGR